MMERAKMTEKRKYLGVKEKTWVVGEGIRILKIILFLNTGKFMILACDACYTLKRPFCLYV